MPKSDLELIGRKGRDFFKRRHSKISGEYTTLFQKAPRYEDALEIARKVIEMFPQGGDRRGLSGGATTSRA